MKYSFWDSVFKRKPLKERNRDLEEQNSDLKATIELLEYKLSLLASQTVKSVEVAKTYKEKFEKLNHSVLKEREDLKNFLQNNS